MTYEFGEEISYDYELIKSEDYDLLQTFSCGNEKLDYFFHNELIQNGEVNIEDGLPFKVYDKKDYRIIGIVSLAASGIVYQVSAHTHVLPAIKIDVFAIDKSFQKLHYDMESKESSCRADHFYFSDAVLATFVQHCRWIAEEKAVAHYILLYADVNAKRFYERNLFMDYTEYMVKENNMEIRKNIPMYLEI